MDYEKYIARRRRQMHFWVALVTLAGILAFCLLVVYGKHRQIYQEHYEFRRHVKPGTHEQQIQARFGAPYRTYHTHASIESIFAGRGVYTSFDRDVAKRERLPQDFEKVLHYRPTSEHGEFVFIGDDGRVLMAVTGRR